MSKRVKVKPGKGQSVMGAVMGIVFCLIGLFIVIPAAGLFGVLWTVMAVIITVTNAVNAFSDKGLSTHEIVIDESDGETFQDKSEEPGIFEDKRSFNSSFNGMPELKNEIELRLKTAEELYQSGTITKAEYERKRAEILKEL